MNQEAINNIIVPLAIVIVGFCIAYVKKEIKKLDDKYSPQIQEVQDIIKSTIGQEQYNKDVEVIKQTLSKLGVTINTLTIPIMEEVIKKVLPNVSINVEKEIENIIIQILKGTL